MLRNARDMLWMIAIAKELSTIHQIHMIAFVKQILKNSKQPIFLVPIPNNIIWQWVSPFLLCTCVYRSIIKTHYPNLRLILCHKDIHMIIGLLSSSKRDPIEKGCVELCMDVDNFNEARSITCQKECYLKGMVSFSN